MTQKFGQAPKFGQVTVSEVSGNRYRLTLTEEDATSSQAETLKAKPQGDNTATVDLFVRRDGDKDYPGAASESSKNSKAHSRFYPVVSVANLDEAAGKARVAGPHRYYGERRNTNDRYSPQELGALSDLLIKAKSTAAADVWSTVMVSLQGFCHFLTWQAGRQEAVAQQALDQAVFVQQAASAELEGLAQLLERLRTSGSGASGDNAVGSQKPSSA